MRDGDTLSAHWIQTMDGAKLDLLNPTEDDIHLTTMAIALSRLCRFSGHCDRFYSVAEHSLRVHALVCDVTDDPQIRAAALLHDAHEAYTGFGDVCRPAKSLTPQVMEIEARLNQVIAAKFGFDPRLFRLPIIQIADGQMLAAEARDLMHDPQDWLPLPDPPKKPIVPMDMRTAAWAFECQVRHCYAVDATYVTTKEKREMKSYHSRVLQLELRRITEFLEERIEETRHEAGFHALEAMEADNQDAVESREQALKLSARASGFTEVLLALRIRIDDLANTASSDTAATPTRR